MIIIQYFCFLLINRLPFQPLKRTLYVALMHWVRCTQSLNMLVMQVVLVRLLAKPHCIQHKLWAFNMSPYPLFMLQINNSRLYSLLVSFILLVCMEYKVRNYLYKVFNICNNKVVYKVVFLLLGLSNRPCLLYQAYPVSHILSSSTLINLGLPLLI